MSIVDARKQQAALDKRLLKLTDVKVSFKEMDTFMVKLGQRGYALGKHSLSWKDDMMPMAREVIPLPKHRSRKAERDWTDRTYAMLERYSCLLDIIHDPRLARWATPAHRPGVPNSTSPLLVAAASHATLVPILVPGTRRMERFRFRVDEVVQLCEALEREVKNMAADRHGEIA